MLIEGENKYKYQAKVACLGSAAMVRILRITCPDLNPTVNSSIWWVI